MVGKEDIISKVYGSIKRYWFTSLSHLKIEDNDRPF